MALLLGALFGMTYNCIESVDVYCTWLWDATLTDFPLDENSKLCPKASRRNSFL